MEVDKHGVPKEGVKYIYNCDPDSAWAKINHRKDIILKRGDIVENVKLMSDNIWVKQTIGCRDFHYEFNVVGDDEVLCVYYPWALIEDSRINRIRIKTLSLLTRRYKEKGK